MCPVSLQQLSSKKKSYPWQMVAKKISQNTVAFFFYLKFPHLTRSRSFSASRVAREGVATSGVMVRNTKYDSFSTEIAVFKRVRVPRPT